jgi:hypothetical protein
MPSGPWLEDIKNQLSIAVVMKDSDVGTAKKLSLIVIDNAVEYMLKLFVDRNRLAAKGKTVGKGQIPAADWADIRSDFSKLTWFVQSKSSLSGKMAQSILDYHDTRNDLYHEAKPRMAYPEDIDKYLGLARDLLTILFSSTMNENQWSQHTEYVRQQILGKRAEPPPTSMRRRVRIDVSQPVVTFETEAELTVNEMILLVVFGYLKQHQRPTADQIFESLTYSHHETPRKTIINRLAELANEEVLGKIDGGYSMKTEGHRTLKGQFDIITQ